MAKKPGLLDLVALIPASDLARAARTLGLDPETLARKVLALDSSGLGSRLVDTATRALKPGEAAGRLMLEHASRIFSQARDFTRDLEELAGLQAPELRFGTDMYAAELPLGAALGRMASANSRLRVQVRTSDFDHLAHEVLAGRLEFAVADATGAERHPARLAIEPVAEHRLFFYVRRGHPLAAAHDHSLATILVFPLVAPRLPQRLGGHVGRLASSARVDEATGDLLPGLMVDAFSVALKAVLAGDAVGLAPLAALDQDLQARRIVLLGFTAPWLQSSYGLFHRRKQSLSRVAQLFMAQLRRIESDLQAREQRALSRLEAPPAPARAASAPARRSRSRRKPAAGSRP